MEEPAARLSKIFYPAVDLGALLAFYQDALGLSVKFRDGDRYAEFHRQEVSLALTAGGEAVTDRPAIGISVPDLEAALAAVLRAGGAVVGPVTEGPHELRAVVRDPAGNQLVVFSPLPRP